MIKCISFHFFFADFEPFNLEAWWGQRVVQSITRNANS